MRKRLDVDVKELEKRIGSGKIHLDRATRIAHRMSHSPEIILHKDRINDFLPDVVVYPKCTEDVVETVKFANKHSIPIIPQGGRISTAGSQGRRGAIALSFVSMSKILEFDELNEWVVVEPGVRTDHLGEFLEERGFCRLEFPNTRSACIGGRAGTDGHNRWSCRWGMGHDNIIALEVVLPDGSVGVLGDGSNMPVKSSFGFNLKHLFIGSRGTLGLATKIWLKTPRLPALDDFGYRAFPRLESAVEAQIEMATDPLTHAWVWRTSGIPRWYLTAFEPFTGKLPPKEIQSLVDFQFFGESVDMLEDVRKRIEDICKKYGGFISDSLPPERQFGRAAYTNRDVGSNRAGALAGLRTINGGRGGMWAPIDPAIPNRSCSEYVRQCAELINRWDSLYPAFANKKASFLPAFSMNASINYIFFYGVFVFDCPEFDQQFSDDFVRFYKDHARLVHSLGGTFTLAHGYAPRIVEEEMIKEEIGELGYRLMKMIKETFDPKNIMNPYIRFLTYEDDPVLNAIKEGR